MDPTTLAAAVVTAVGPCLPRLLELGGKVADGAAEKAGELLLSGAYKLWETLRAKFSQHPGLERAAQDLAHAPADPDLAAALRVQLRTLLAADPALAAELAALLQSSGGTHIEQRVSGKGHIVSAGDQDIGSVTQHFQ